ncbi:TetR/AcrR family transcriptional regulator [Micromonospora sp. CB01531]|uniref:TetR/AcrR family transcriptional regulator n=1 Tax=Micromonospora sp. CB01531 TaxID=1718947 RepID=UPI00093CAF1C|nr:TetR/AcrR family transcriptional regulator [Micromonospora sp. CB01531]OKI84550.1 hypothetical protein A6A27_40410 [Micromonospora sp. CB01531]
MPKPSLRESLLEAGLAEFHTNGYAATGVAAIAQRAGGPKGSFYNHFASKEELGLAALDSYGHSRRLDMLRDPSMPPLDRIRRHLAYLRSDLARHDFTRACLLGTFAAESAGSKAISQAARAGLEDWVDVLTEAIEAARHDAEFSGALPARSLAQLIVDAWEGAALRAKASGDPAPIDNLLELVFGSILAADAEKA